MTGKTPTAQVLEGLVALGATLERGDALDKNGGAPRPDQAERT